VVSDVLAVAFNLFDLTGDEVIHRTELKQILEPSFANVFKPEQIDAIVDTTFEEFGMLPAPSTHTHFFCFHVTVCLSPGAGEPPQEGEEKSMQMSFRRFEEMCRQQPAAISMFTIPTIAQRR